MTLPIKITVIRRRLGILRREYLSGICARRNYGGSTLALVDRNTGSLDIVHRLANRFESRVGGAVCRQRAHGSLRSINLTAIRRQCNRGRCTRKSVEKDLKIPSNMVSPAVRENGGPGGFAHAARNIGPILKIAHDMESLCRRPGSSNSPSDGPHLRRGQSPQQDQSRWLVPSNLRGVRHGWLALAKDLGIEVPKG